MLPSQSRTRARIESITPKRQNLRGWLWQRKSKCAGYWKLEKVGLSGSPLTPDPSPPRGEGRIILTAHYGGVIPEPLPCEGAPHVALPLFARIACAQRR